MTYRFLDHTADVGLEIAAESLEQLFSDALRGMSDVITQAERLESRLERKFELSAEGLDLLLLDFLNEALVRFEVERELFRGARLVIAEGDGGWSLSGVAVGDLFDPERYPPRVMIKAVTYHQLSVERDPDGGWRARVIFDI